jgi:ABC-type polysaccharide/polyol phosphate export permease
MTSAKELVAGRSLLWNLTLRELRGKFKRTALGWAWSMLNPLSTIIIYSLVFSTFLTGMPEKGNPSGLFNFTLWLSCGLLPWNFTNNGIQAALPSIVGNSNLVKKVYFPREYVVASNVLSWIVTYGIELSVLSIVFLFFGHVVFMWIPIVLFFMALQLVFVLGIALLLSSLNVYFRDIQHFVGIGMQVWFYLTPIVYRTELVRERLDDRPVLWQIFKLNPMIRFVDAYRDLFYSGRMPPLSTFIICIVTALISALVGWRVFSRLEPRFAEEL